MKITISLIYNLIIKLNINSIEIAFFQHSVVTLVLDTYALEFTYCTNDF